MIFLSDRRTQFFESDHESKPSFRRDVGAGALFRFVLRTRFILRITVRWAAKEGGELFRRWPAELGMPVAYPAILTTVHPLERAS